MQLIGVTALGARVTFGLLICKDACGCKRSGAEHSVRDIKRSRDKRIIPLMSIVVMKSDKDRVQHRVVCGIITRNREDRTVLIKTYSTYLSLGLCGEA